MNPIDRPMTKQEWLFKYDRIWHLTPETLKQMLEDARFFMVPADTQLVPKPEDWPEWASGLSVVFHQGSGPYNPASMSMVEVWVHAPRHIPTKKPWVPKAGDPVFVLLTLGGNMNVGEVADVRDDKVWVAFNGKTERFWLPDVKPFDILYLGRSWNDTPKGASE